MAEAQFECVVAAPIERVWAWHQDVRGALVALSPPADDVRIESVDEPVVVGSRVVILAKGPMGRVRWVAEYAEIVPPHAVAFGVEARFVDVQISGPFAAWRHSHEFEAVDSKTTRIVDRIEYRVPYGPVGVIGDFVVVRPKLRAMFAHRHKATKAALE